MLTLPNQATVARALQQELLIVPPPLTHEMIVSLVYRAINNSTVQLVREDDALPPG